MDRQFVTPDHLVELIENLMSPDSEKIQKATADIQEVYKNPETVPLFCQIAVSAAEKQVRQYAAVLLKKQLGKGRLWNKVPLEQQELIKQGMVRALMQEEQASVRKAIAQVVGILLHHESKKSQLYMSEVLNFIYTTCSSADPKQSEIGSSTFAVLADTAPDQFSPHIGDVCEMLYAALVANESTGNMATPVLCNIMSGMTYLVPFTMGHNGAEQSMMKSLPLIVKALQAFAVQADVDQFIRAFDILEGIADLNSKILNNYIKILVEFCFEISSNAQLESGIRIKTIGYIGWLVRLKKKVLIKLKLMDQIIKVVFNVMATEPEDDDGDYFLGGDDSVSPMTTATQTMDLLALSMPSEKLIPPLLALLEPALHHPDPLSRRAAYLSMAVVSEGCSETICAKYLETMLNIVKSGITDAQPMVRNAAFFALGQFSEHLQPDISKFAPEIMPILFQFLQQLCVQLKSGNEADPKHVERIFYAVETFCENLEDELVQYLPPLMEILFDAMSPRNSERVRELALSAISAAANATNESMMPYFQSLINLLQSYLVETDDESITNLRPQAIDTLAAIARAVGKENFMPLTSDTMNFALELLNKTDDPDVRRSLYNLMAAMAKVLNEEMASVYPKIIQRIYDSILSTEEVVPEFSENDDVPPSIDLGDDNDADIDIENSEEDEEDEDDMENIAGYSVENSYLEEKEEAVIALKEFAEHSGAAFIPYLELSYQNVYKMIDHPQEDVRKVSIDTLCTFVLALFRYNDIVAVTNAVTPLLPKLERIVRDDEEVTVALSVFEGLHDMLKEIKEVALSSEALRDCVFRSIEEVMQGKAACQYFEPLEGEEENGEESEYDESLIEAAGNILPLFGLAMTPQQFAPYFDRVYPFILQKLQNATTESVRSFAYGCFAECFEPLEDNCGLLFGTFCSIMINGVSDTYGQARQNAIYGLGELVLYAGQSAYEAYPMILQALSQAVAKETAPSAIDNICGALSRIIISNITLVPLSQVLPVFMQHLPLREDFEENYHVFKCLDTLYMKARETISTSLEQVIAIAIHVLYKKEYSKSETYDLALGLVMKIRIDYPDVFAGVSNSNPEVIEFLQTLESIEI